MTVDFYTITDPPNKLVKNVTSESKLVKNVTSESKLTIQNVDIFKPSDIMSPRIILGTFTNMMSKNYCYIDKFARWYYISNITLTSAQRVMMDLSIDVLHTYSDDILRCKGTAIRSESEGKTYIPDSKYPIDQLTKNIDMINFNTPFSAAAVAGYIITTIGGNA